MNYTTLNTSFNQSLINSKPECPPLEIYFLNVPRNLLYDSLLLGIIVFHVVTACLAIVSNFTVIYTITRTPSLQTPANILILGLAISDLGGALLTQSSYTVYKYGEYTRDVDLYCTSGTIVTTVSSAFATITFVSLTAVTGDRFLAIQMHLRYQELVTAKRCGQLIAFIWVSSVIVCILRFYLYQNTVILSVAIMLFLFSFVLNIFFLIKIYRVLHRHSVQIQAQQQSVQQSFNMPVYKKTVKTTFYITGTFLICFIPVWANVLVYIIVRKHTIPIRFLFTITETIAMLNGALNPFIYCWRIKEIRNQALRLLKLKT